MKLMVRTADGEFVEVSKPAASPETRRSPTLASLLADRQRFLAEQESLIESISDPHMRAAAVAARAASAIR
jgi:hypothetical protein